MARRRGCGLPCFVSVVAGAVVGGRGCWEALRPIVHVDAIHRARGQAQLAARAPGSDHLVQLARGAQDRIDRAGWQAARAADAGFRIDPGQPGGSFGAMVRIQRERFAVQECGQPADQRSAARRALIDRRCAGGDGLRIGQTPGVAAARALRLRQQRVDVRGLNSTHGPSSAVAQCAVHVNGIDCAAMFANLTPTVRTLLIANLAVFAAQTFFGAELFAPLELWPLHGDLLYGGLPFEPWQLISYGFLHFQFWHLFANMFALYMFGPDVERLLGSARFRVFYLVCLVGAALTQLVVGATIQPSPYPTLGASGAIFGILLCYGMGF